ncbi:hypothetical protein SDC9_186327 [bioreactor metagenome]|uniref:Uncharacterized protein n=1 Tax=bioreactor metagenome TaxID=1076179 RepID=A0A645HK86_9ZZZZ
MMAIFGFLLFHQGQADVDPRAALRCIADFDAALVFVDDLPDDGQAEAGSPGLGSDIGFEDARQQLDRKARAIVGNRQACMAEAPFGTQDDARTLESFQRILGIAQQVVDDLA